MTSILVDATNIWTGSIIPVLSIAKRSSFRIAWVCRITPVLVLSTIIGRIRSRSVLVIVWESSIRIPMDSRHCKHAHASNISCGMKPILDARSNALRSPTQRSIHSLRSTNASADLVSFGILTLTAARWTAKTSGMPKQESMIPTAPVWIIKILTVHRSPAHLQVLQVFSAVLCRLLALRLAVPWVIYGLFSFGYYGFFDL